MFDHRDKYYVEMQNIPYDLKASLSDLTFSLHRHRRRYGSFENMYDNSRRWSHHGAGFQVPGLVPDEQIVKHQNSYEDYLRRRDVRQDNRYNIYDDTDETK